MFYYYRVWRPILGGGYDTLLFQGEFYAGHNESATFHARNIAKVWGDEIGDCCVEYSTARDARSPHVVFFPCN